ncbi:hypothetical protein Bbelb_018120 [Branchiostoma belcheri]|nr:hypothetical protein Bbelb_018120 [Branchiostoma belcheri]
MGAVTLICKSHLEKQCHPDVNNLNLRPLKHDPIKQLIKPKLKSMPSMLLTNARSSVHKLDELSLVLSVNNMDIAVWLKQVVTYTEPTRADNVLDSIITNVHSHYQAPVSSAPLGASDHNWVIWKPEVRLHHCEPSGVLHRLVSQDQKDALGLCMALTAWCSVYSASTVEEKVTTFYNIVQTMLNTCIPFKKKKVRDVDVLDDRQNQIST